MSRTFASLAFLFAAFCSASPASAQIVCNPLTKLTNAFDRPPAQLLPARPLPGQSRPDEDALSSRDRAFDQLGLGEPANLVDTLADAAAVKVVGYRKDGYGLSWLHIWFRHSRTGILSDGYIFEPRLAVGPECPASTASQERTAYFAVQPDDYPQPQIVQCFKVDPKRNFDSDGRRDDCDRPYPNR